MLKPFHVIWFYQGLAGWNSPQKVCLQVSCRSFVRRVRRDQWMSPSRNCFVAKEATMSKRQKVAEVLATSWCASSDLRADTSPPLPTWVPEGSSDNTLWVFFFFLLSPGAIELENCKNTINMSHFHLQQNKKMLQILRKCFFCFCFFFCKPTVVLKKVVDGVASVCMSGSPWTWSGNLHFALDADIFESVRLTVPERANNDLDLRLQFVPGLLSCPHRMRDV